jgi:myo-inositol 2-dehydrogenase/D-chiro-inositol 1-dehydrogenase
MAHDSAARIAFVGAGNHATQSLYPNIAHIPEFDLVAVCDLVGEKAEHAARRFGALQAFTDLHTMLDQADPQAVCVCGPAEMHHAVALEVLRRGLPVFMEKPPALTAAQARELVDAARQAATWGMVAFMKRFAPANLVAREFMATAGFGDLSSLSMIHGAGPYDDLRRMLLFNGIHMLDLARFFAGDVAEVFAHRSPEGASVQVASIGFRFTSGAVGQFNMNSGHNWQDCFEQTYLTGNGAALLIDASKAVEVMAADRRFADAPGQELFGWSSRYYVSGNMAGWAAGGHYTRGYWGELSHFAKAVLGQVEPNATLEDGLCAMELIEAIVESVTTGRLVPVTGGEQ